MKMTRFALVVMLLIGIAIVARFAGAAQANGAGEGAGSSVVTGR